ncbi:uncharacterized protein LOC128678848 [Plodia interpunctella]|uniref:uncharacterized protein LOC128678848 n=1 Tax=Plodia interpunctella TaxID=58824 RepID=UPI002367D429|nr:uncharacterized protein LOC128678848 [Plodia interpunctella]
MDLEPDPDPPDPKDDSGDFADTTNSIFSKPMFFVDEYDHSNIAEFVNIKNKKKEKKNKLSNSFKTKHTDKQLSMRPLQQALVSENLILNKKTPNIAGPPLQVESSLEPASVTQRAPKVAESPYRTFYMQTDPGPYMVQATLISEPMSGTTLHPLKFGSFLMKNGLGNILQDGIKRIGRNRISITFKTCSDANNFLNVMSKNLDYKVAIPTFNICKMGLVKGIPVEWTHEDIKMNLQIPDGYGPIVKSRRLSRRTVNSDSVSWTPTQSVVLTFDGQALPSRVYSFFSSIPVEQYIFPTIQCFNCCRFGHTRNNCRSKPRCSKCSGEHSGLSCLVTEYVCVNCSEPHMATNKLCPEFNRQTNIKKHMSENSTSYQEAAKLFPFKNTYSHVATSLQSSHPPSSNSVLDNNNIHSYKKTIVKKPKQAPSHSPGYDKQEHNSLIRSISFEETRTTGTALPANKAPLPSSEELNKLLSTLVNIIANSNLPESVAVTIINNISISIFNIFKHGSSPPVEL